MNCTEGRSGQRDEESRMRADLDGRALPTNESGRNQDPGVSPIEIRARRTYNFTPVLAGDSKIAFRYFASRGIHNLAS
jgi:hypothetical protein